MLQLTGAAILLYIVLGETLGYKGIISGCIFITALILAAGTEIPATTTESPTAPTTREGTVCKKKKYSMNTVTVYYNAILI